MPLHVMMAMHYPVPQRGGILEKKFTYFYKPYNYNINTKIYMTYLEDEGSEKLQGFDEYVRLKRL